MAFGRIRGPVRLLQPEKTEVPIAVTAEGIVSEPDKELQF